MCGIIGFKGSFTPENASLVKGLLEQSQIRGKHATGVSYIRNKTIKTIKAPMPAKTFLSMYWHEIESDLSQEGEISLIGHTRYSTSGLEHNQPHFDEAMAVAFNGVVTQADPAHWKELYGFEPQTTNDVEILHHVMVNGQEPLTCLGTASLAVVALKRSGVVVAFRNGARPMYTAHSRYHLNSVVIASTMQVLTRAGIPEVDISGTAAGITSYLRKDKDENGNILYDASVNMVDPIRDLQSERFT